MDQPDPDHRKSCKSGLSATSSASALTRWRSYMTPFASREASDSYGGGSCDNGFEGQWHNGVPSVRPRKFSKQGQEGWPRALSNAGQKPRKKGHTRFASSQAMSGADGFRITYGATAATSDDEDAATGGVSPMQRRSSEIAQDVDIDIEDIADDDAMGLASQRKSNRYSGRMSPSGRKSPLSPTFGFNARERQAGERLTRSILKRETIRLSALPPLPKGERSRRSFPAGHGLAPLSSNPEKTRGLDRSFVFPGSDEAGMRSSNTPRFVAFNGPLDPARPENRHLPVKLLSTILLLALTFTVTFVSAALAPASFQISQAFETDSEIIILASALAILGFAFGAPLFGAVGEQYGRKRPLLLGLAVFAIFNTPLATTENLATLCAFRFFAGLFGSAVIVIVPAALADLWSPVGRGIALSFFAAVLVIGPVVGAVAGSYLAIETYPAWRWTSWIVVGLTVLFGLPLALVYSESSTSTLLQRKAQRLRRVTKDWSFHAEVEESGGNFAAQLSKTALLFAEPTLILPTVHMSFACGLLNMLFVSYGFAFHDERHWVRGAQDLPLLPTIFGCLVGIFINFVVSKKKYTAVWVRDGSASPEARLVPWIIGSWILPIGLLIFAWTSSPTITFIPQLMAGVPTGIGITLILIGGFNYIVDTYAELPSLAIGTNTFIRSTIAFAFPLFAPRMYQNLGIGWANTVLAGVTVALVPIPLLLLKLGPRLRMMGRLAKKPRRGRDDRGEDFGAEMAQRDPSFTVTIEGGVPYKTTA